MKMIDLRSDTCTLPTQEMRDAMAKAEVGNDGFGEDPSMNLLEEKAAELMGKEAALFAASGTMGNLLANMTHGKECDEVIMEAGSHALNNEFGGVSTIANRIPRSLRGVNGAIPVEEIRSLIRTSGGTVETGLIWLENSHNNAGGVCLNSKYIADVCNLAHSYGVPVHVDGARIFNASAALGISAKELCAPVDSVMFCLSKGLSCPVGSMLVGSKEFIKRARHNRKRLGGQMRQAGVLATAGIVALNHMIDRLREDNENAHFLAASLQAISELGIDMSKVETNIVLFNLEGKLKGKAKEIGFALKKENILVNVRGDSIIRVVTHKDVTKEDAKTAVMKIAEITKEM